VIPSYRGKGVGNDLFNFTLRKFGFLVLNGIWLVKEKGLLPEESAIRKNRISFLYAVGFKNVGRS
jgi:hypothetical protein